jgi:hypothetical protein
LGQGQQTPGGGARLSSQGAWIRGSWPRPAWHQHEAASEE